MGKRVIPMSILRNFCKENLQLKKDGKPIFNLIPQKGFQEKVLLTQADIKIVGGKRGGGRPGLHSLRLSHISLIPMSICTDSVSMRTMSSEVSGNRASL